uniref:Tyrosine specific protein phosphatases domain-containing protein n=1 Tax=Timema shepardi TaxID=629360 RepID=A0A7R9AS23_TIMSH|nr:unnamed protein product [Timema shepardi]
MNRGKLGRKELHHNAVIDVQSQGVTHLQHSRHSHSNGRWGVATDVWPTDTLLYVCYKSVGIHCRMGRGRTGVMAACYLVHFLDQPPERAIINIRLMRPGSVETYEQEKAVVAYHDYLRRTKSLRDMKSYHTVADCSLLKRRLGDHCSRLSLLRTRRVGVTCTCGRHPRLKASVFTSVYMSVLPHLRL